MYFYIEEIYTYISNPNLHNESHNLFTDIGPYSLQVVFQISFHLKVYKNNHLYYSNFLIKII